MTKRTIVKHLIAILLILRLGLIDAQALQDQGLQQFDQQIDNIWEYMVFDSEEAYQLALKCLKEAESINYEKGQADCANALGILNLDKQAFQEAEQYFNRALKLRTKLQDQSGQASVLHNMAALSCEQSNYPEAMKKAFSAISIWETLEEHNQLGKAYNTLSNIYSSNGDYDLALAYSKKSLEILLLTDDFYAIADAQYNLAERYYQMDELDRAQTLFEAALVLYRDSFFDIGAQADVYNALGAIVMEKGNLSQAEGYFHESEVIYKEMEDQVGLFDIYSNLGLLEETKQHFTKAISYYQKAEKTLGEEATLENRLYLLNQYVAVYQNLGDFERAFYYQKEATILEDSILNEAKQLQIASLQVEFDTERLAKENIAKNIENQKKTFERDLFMLASGCLFLLLMIGLYALAQHRKANVLVLQQREIQHQREIGALLKEQEYQLVRGRLNGQATERKRLALAINDELASRIAALNWQLEALKDQLQDQSEPLNKVQAAVKGIFLHINNMVEHLKATNPNGGGLENALRKLKSIVEKESEIKTDIQFLGINEGINPQVEIAVYRILRELVSNVIKHANATELSIQLYQKNGCLNILVEDNGKGFNADQNTHLGVGLKRMELLIQHLEGNFSINSSPAGGTTILVDLPV